MHDTFSHNKNNDVESTYKETKYKDDIDEIVKAVSYEAYRIEQKQALKRKKRRKKIIIRLTALITAFILAVSLVIFGIVSLISLISNSIGAPSKDEVNDLLSRASVAAANYDYDGAIEIICSFGANYEKSAELKQAVLNYSGLKATLAKYADSKNVTHISFRTLICDTKMAFDGDENEAKYNKNMTTTNEFLNILTEIYNQNHILVSINDIVEIKDGKIVQKDLYLPSGKKPVIISQEDVSYSENLSKDGFPSKLKVLKDGSFINEYIDKNGKKQVGNYDLVPILEEFIKENPDFSYKGARAILGVTGSDGIFGYRTNPDSESYVEGDENRAKVVCDKLKNAGYEFACNSYDYIDFKSYGLPGIKKDIELWFDKVSKITGKTDILMYPDGNDIKSGAYNLYGEKYVYLKSKGFNFFLYGDNAKYSTDITENYVKQGRRILSGYRLENEPDKLFDLFDIGRVIDIARP